MHEFVVFCSTCTMSSYRKFTFAISSIPWWVSCPSCEHAKSAWVCCVSDRCGGDPCCTDDDRQSSNHLLVQSHLPVHTWALSDRGAWCGGRRGIDDGKDRRRRRTSHRWSRQSLYIIQHRRTSFLFIFPH